MIEIRGMSYEYEYQDFVFTVEKAIEDDYRYWKTYHRAFEFYYQGQLLKRLDDNCSFIEEIEYLKHQIMVILGIRD